MPRTIVHVDLDAFYCSIEEQRDPTLRGVPFAVGARAEDRGVVASCSYAARRCGVRSAMSMAQARRLCPHLRIVPSRHGEYRAVSRRVMRCLRGVTSSVEPLSIDEAFLDVSALMPVGHAARAGRALAKRIQTQIRHDLGLSCSVGVASNKLVAKIATDCGKAGMKTGHLPGAICVVPAGEEASFLAPLPVSALWGVGPKTEARLVAMRIATIGDIARATPRDLMRHFGTHGYELWQHAQGIDKREVVIHRESKSISSETTFVQDVSEWDELLQVLAGQCQSVAGQLQKQKLQATTVRVKVRWPDFTTPTRQATLVEPTDQSAVIIEYATQLLRELWPPGQRVRLLGVGVSGLSAVRQLSLWDDAEKEWPAAKTDTAKESADEPIERSEVNVLSAKLAAQEFGQRQERLWQAVLELQQRYGDQCVQLGVEDPVDELAVDDADL